MRHRVKGKSFGRTAEHRRAMMRNMASSLFLHGRIETTTEKAKELRRYAEPIITKAKRGDLHARRLVQRTEDQMLNIENFGIKSLEEIRQFLNEHNLHFGMKLEEGEDGELFLIDERSTREQSAAEAGADAAGE